MTGDLGLPESPTVSATPELAATHLSPEGHDPQSQEPVALDSGLKRLLVWYGLGTMGIWLTIGAVNAVLLPVQIADLDESRKAANLGIVTAIGALVGMLAQPLAGLFSDRTKNRRGRRAPWILAGVMLASVALAVLGTLNALVAIGAVYAVLQIGLNLALGPKSAILPDRVPRSVRGLFSAAAGLGVLFGVLGGQILAVAFTDNLVIGYVVLAVVLAAATTGLVYRNPDHDSRANEHPALKMSVVVATFWVNPRKHPDFAWGFLGRLLTLVGFYLANSFQLFLLEDYIGLGDKAEKMIQLFAGVALLATLISTVVGGPLSDRIGRRKPIAVAAGLLIAIALVAPWVMPTTTGFFIYAVLAGLGFGAYLAVDQALLSEVLPSTADNGRYLGVLNIAAALPAAIAAGLAGAIVSIWDYDMIFPIGIIAAVLGALAILPIKSVR